jgi:hypothetical protein
MRAETEHPRAGRRAFTVALVGFALGFFVVGVWRGVDWFVARRVRAALDTLPE